MKPKTHQELLLLLHTKLDEVKDDIHEIKITQVKHEGNLQEHIRRSEIAEQRLDLIEGEVKPILQGMGFLKTIAKIVTTISSLLYAASKFFR